MSVSTAARGGIAACALLLALAACSDDAAGGETETPEEPTTSAPDSEGDRDSSPELRTVSITQAPLTYYAPIWIADELGFFAEEGIQIEFAESVPTGAGQIAMITSGQVDVIASAPASMMQSLAEGLETQFIVGIADFASTDDTDSGGLIVPADSDITRPRDLNGRTVGVTSIQSMQQTKVAATIDHDGGDSTTVEFVQVPPPTMPGLLNTGEIDAAAPLQPGLTELLESGEYKRISGVNWVALGGTPGLSIASTPQWISENTDTAEAIRRAIEVAVDWATDPSNRGQLNEILADHLEADVAILEKWLPDAYNAEVSLSALEKLQTHLLDYGVMSDGVDLERLIWK